MWDEVAASNDAAWGASEAWVQRRRLGPDHRDYHNLHWLIYACLQQGRFARAGELVDIFRSMRGDLTPDTVHFFNKSIAAFVIETESWDRADALFAGAPAAGVVAADSASSRRAVEICGGELDGPGKSGTDPGGCPAGLSAALAAATRGHCGCGCPA
jgi:hypothetical protein